MKPMHAAVTNVAIGNFDLSPAARSFFNIEQLEGMLLTDMDEGDERLTGYELTWLLKGSAFLIADGVPRPLQAGSMVCLFPGQLRVFRMMENVKGFRLRFSPELLLTTSFCARAVPWLYSNNGSGPVSILYTEQEVQDDWMQIMTLMVKEYANFSILRSEILAGLLNILLIHISRKLGSAYESYPVSRDAELARRFRDLLKMRFTVKKLVAEYAAELCVTPNYLNRTVKKVTGFTASHHIQQHIILEAKRIAIQSNQSMKEVAYQLGFDNLAHFSKFFKNKSGENFTSFKKGIYCTDN